MIRMMCYICQCQQRMTPLISMLSELKGIFLFCFGCLLRGHWLTPSKPSCGVCQGHEIQFKNTKFSVKKQTKNDKQTPDISGVLTRSTHPTFLDKKTTGSNRHCRLWARQELLSLHTPQDLIGQNVTQAYTIVVWYDKYDSRLCSGLHYRGLVR